MLYDAKPSLSRAFTLALTLLTLLTVSGCAAKPIIHPIDRPPPLAACDYISVGPLNGWAVTAFRDGSYTLLWGQTGVSARVPAERSPLNFPDLYGLVTRITFDASLNDDRALQVYLTAGTHGHLDQFAAATTSVEEIKVILEAAQVGARPYWAYERPTLDELQWKYPLTMTPRTATPTR